MYAGQDKPAWLPGTLARNDLAASRNVWHASIPEEHVGDHSVLDLRRSFPNSPLPEQRHTRSLLIGGPKCARKLHLSPAALLRSIICLFTNTNE